MLRAFKNAAPKRDVALPRARVARAVILYIFIIARFQLFFKSLRGAFRKMTENLLKIAEKTAAAEAAAVKKGG